jgi:hypothetical protein
MLLSMCTFVTTWKSRKPPDGRSIIEESCRFNPRSRAPRIKQEAGDRGVGAVGFVFLCGTSSMVLVRLVGHMEVK